MVTICGIPLKPSVASNQQRRSASPPIAMFLSARRPAVLVIGIVVGVTQTLIPLRIGGKQRRRPHATSEARYNSSDRSHFFAASQC